MSVVWISIYSYLLMWMITVIGYTFHIPDTIMAIIFLAFGVSMPDAIASWIVVKNGTYLLFTYFSMLYKLRKKGNTSK